MGHLPTVEMRRMQTEKVAFIQVFHPIQSVKSTNTMITRYTHVKSKSGASTLASLSNAKPLMST